MKTLRIRMCIPAAALLLVALGGCSGGPGDASAAGSAPGPMDDAAFGQAADAIQALKPAGPGAANGEMTSLLAKLPPPARTAVEANAQFHWSDTDPEPIGALRSGLDALKAAKAASDSRQQQLARQARPANPAAYGMPVSDAATAAALKEKLQNMDRTQQIAYAIQMNEQAAQRMQAQMQSAGDPEAVARAQEDVQQVVTQMSLLYARIAARQQQADAQKARIERQAAAAHAAVDKSLEDAMTEIPYEREGEGGGGCFSEANAHRVQALLDRAADRHVAVADDELKQAAQWAGEMRAFLQPQARAMDAAVARISADLANVHSGLLHRQMSAELESERGDGRQFMPYWQGVRDFDFAAAKWVRERDRQKARSWRDQLCR